MGYTERHERREQELHRGGRYVERGQAADNLQLSHSSIRSYVRQGKLKAFRVSGLRKVLIPRYELLSLLEPPNSSHDQMPVP